MTMGLLMLKMTMGANSVKVSLTLVDYSTHKKNPT